LRFFVVQPLLGLELFDDRSAQLINARCRRVLCKAGTNGRFRRGLDRFRRIEIRFTGGKVDDVDALRGHGFRGRRHREGRGGSDATDASRQLHGFTLRMRA
jgi:hypothetical protein